MKKNLFYPIFFSVLSVFISTTVRANHTMEEYFYASGKFKVVIAVAAIVLAGVFVYLISLDRRLKKIEKERKNPS